MLSQRSGNVPENLTKIFFNSFPRSIDYYKSNGLKNSLEAEKYYLNKEPKWLSEEPIVLVEKPLKRSTTFDYEQQQKAPFYTTAQVKSTFKIFLFNKI